MPYDTLLADRISNWFTRKKVPFEAKKMMGGLTYMVNDKMCTGIIHNELMARVGPAVYEEALQKEGCRPMDFTGRPLKGYVMVNPQALAGEKDLDYWMQLALDFNPKAQPSRKKKKA